MLQNNIFRNWKKGCYIAKLVETKEDDCGNEINIFEKPKPYNINVQPANGDTDVTLYGEKVTKMQKAVVPFFKFTGVFKEGDVAYLEGATPVLEVEGVYGCNANYKIVSVREQNMVIVIYFEKMI